MDNSMRLYEKEFDPFFTQTADAVMGTDYTKQAYIQYYYKKKENGPLPTFDACFSKVLEETGGNRKLYLRSIDTDKYDN